MARHYPDVLTALRNHLPRDGKVLAAVSGGMDSVALLRALTLIAPEQKISIEVAHVNHGLRPHAREDFAFTQQLVTQVYRLPFHSITLTPPEHRANIEAWGREERYKYLEDIRQKNSLDWIVTAHHAGDSVETFLMRLITGKELKGIAQKDPVRKLIRPLLEVSKQTLHVFSKEQKISWREDESNLDLSFLRNKVRHRLIPFLLSEFGENEIETIARRAEYQIADIEALEQLASEAARKVALAELQEPSRLKAFREQLAVLHPALNWRVISELLLPILGYRLGREHCIKALQIINGEIVGTQLPGGWDLTRVKGGLFINSR